MRPMSIDNETSKSFPCWIIDINKRLGEVTKCTDCFFLIYIYLYFCTGSVIIIRLLFECTILLGNAFYVKKHTNKLEQKA